MRHRTPLTRLLLLLVAIYGSACDTTGVNREYELTRGIIDPHFYYWDDPTIVVPEEAAMGEHLTVNVTTFGDGCRLKGQTEFAVDGLVATVEPYDSMCVSCSICTRELRMFEHVAIVQFAEPGQATVRIVGAIAPADTVGTVEFTIHVRDP